MHVRSTRGAGASRGGRGLGRGLRRRLGAAFAKHQLILRANGRVRLITIGRGAQVLAVAALATFLGWPVYLILGHLEKSELIAAKEREIGALKLAYRSLQSEVDRSEARFRTHARTLEAKHAYLVALLERKQALAPDDGSVVEGGGNGSDLAGRIETTRRRLLAQLGELEIVMADPAVGEGSNDREHLAVERRASFSVAERVRMDRERRRLVTRIEQLEDRLVAINRSQRGIAARMTQRVVDRIDRVRELIEGTGIDMDALMARIGDGTAPGIGGPFIAAGAEMAAGVVIPSSIGALDLHLGRLEDVRRLVGILPLSAPSDHFYVASGFGKRRDPINKRWAMHYGVDMAGVYRSPVRATAPGTVTSAGWSGYYGRMVEIDHGMGIRTRYGHLRRILVRRGDKVDLRQKVGEMGNSGRSTGTHIHYEILVNGEPKDPLKFLQAGEYLLKTN